jgi:hypothetical protein
MITGMVSEKYQLTIPVQGRAMNAEFQHACPAIMRVINCDLNSSVPEHIYYEGFICKYDYLSPWELSSMYTGDSGNRLVMYAHFQRV